MKKIYVLLIIVVALSLVSGCFQEQEKKTTATTEDHSVHNTSKSQKKTLYTCGMHPNVIQEGPGNCPICGMDLVPMKGGATKASQDNPAVETSADESSRSGSKKEKKIKYWVAPMDPNYIRDEPGKSPMGMDLVPVYEDEDEGSRDSGKAVRIDPVVVQNMGVRTAHVMRTDLKRSIRTIGEVDVAEDSVSVVNLRYSGWIEKIFADETGAYIKKGQPLFRIYSPELVQAQQEYIQAFDSTGPDSPLTSSARTRLELAGVGSWLIKALEGKKKSFKTLTVTSPQNGYVLHKNVVEGSKVNAGQDIYRIGNLAFIWVNVDVYEFDAPWIEKGDPARMELSFEKGKTFAGKVAYVYPTLDKRTRTLKTRLEFPNPGLVLKPGMFATVWIEAQNKPGVLAVPTEAILHSGERQLVFVSKGNGRYQPIDIVTGLVGDGRMTEVISGLSEHDVVVTSGQFLLDSESQLQEAVAKLLSARLEAKNPATGASDEKTDSKDDHNHDGETYWTCPMHPQIVQDDPGQCSICKMDLVEKNK